ncbi:hypothetical protein C823_005091 [Eubacterium plexicaudatum ASF492]|uniref:DUF1848 domain-containing protein n=1 Tax=Eubacterium plexicaudatum ASF492 TaxID=1235802 RepID=N1ZY90_9FIRM|nr:hypothetical protein C823_005091 [Eubacterium plexicaudatum ASF492]
MIISASRRTDIPSYYSEWFFNRLKEQYVLVRNPMNMHQIGKIDLSPKVVDGIVFWTKNPVPMLNRLEELEKYNYYFQFTLTAYGPEVETGLPSKNKVIIPSFQRLSKEIGKKKVVWRYDPIFLNEKYTIDYHCRYFAVLASKLAPYTEKCTISFLDYYRNTERNMKPLHIHPLTVEQQKEIIEKFVRIAQRYNLHLDTCAESCDFGKFGVSHACCIDKERFERIGKYKLNVEKDKNQREECGCVASIDIGAYNTCRNGCLYCYANYSGMSVNNNFGKHNLESPLLFGKVNEEDKVKERNVTSLIDRQMTLFE